MSDDALGVPEHRDTVERLERGVARVAPPDDLFDRIAAETRPAPVLPLRRRIAVWVAPAAAAAVGAAAAVLITLSVTDGGEDLGGPVAKTSFTGARVSGEVALYRPDERDGLVVVDLERVPQPPAASYYEIWIARSDGRKVPIGTFTPQEGKAHLELRLPKPGRYLSIDISIEDENGPPDHSGRTIAAARLA